MRRAKVFFDPLRIKPAGVAEQSRHIWLMGSYMEAFVYGYITGRYSNSIHDNVHILPPLHNDLCKYINPAK
jgi:hypothetical protein